MRKFGLMVAVALAAVACATGADMVVEMMDSGVPDAGAQPGTPGDGSSMRYVGNSERRFRGANRAQDADGNLVRDERGQRIPVGIFELYEACQDTFGAGHRTCTRDEILFTTRIPQTSGLAWYGVESTCGSGQRAAVSSTGVFSSEPCSVTTDEQNPGVTSLLPVACCGPN